MNPNDLTHTQLLLIAAILCFPALWQAVANRVVHPLWLATAMVALVGLVVLW